MKIKSLTIMALALTVGLASAADFSKFFQAYVAYKHYKQMQAMSAMFAYRQAAAAQNNAQVVPQNNTQNNINQDNSGQGTAQAAPESDNGRPLATAKAFVDALINLDFDEARSLCDKNALSAVNRFESEVNSVSDADVQKFSLAWRTVKVQKEYWPNPFTRQYAMVTAMVFGKKVKMESFLLEKIDGEWRVVDISK